MVFKAWFFSAAIVAAVLSPIVPAVAGSTQQDQDQSSNPPAQAQQAPAPPDAAAQQQAIKSLPPGPGRDQVVRVCTGCHLLNVVTTQRKNESDWTDTVVEMRNRGANASDDDMEKIVEYLAKNFGPNSPPPAAPKVNVNTASADAIAAALSIPQSQAQAIVDYRAKNGNFKDIDALKQVPGIEADKIDAAKDRIEF